MESKRFEITETEGSVKGFYVVVDKETGVNLSGFNSPQLAA